jgi:alpha,alpha-trehalose phosphorylase
MSLGHHDSAGAFRIDGVTGPDEYSAVADNNVYTNLAARRNLLDAADWAESESKLARGFEVDEEETASWRDAADAMTVPFDDDLGVHQQSEGFTDHARWDFESTPDDHYPLFLHYPYFDIYRKQVIKQADLVLAMGVFGDQFTEEQKARNFAYYEELTVRDSSLSACTQAVIAAEVGQLELAFDYAVEAALMDLDDLEHNTRDGVHIASLAGAWIAVVAGFGGFRDYGGELLFSPRVPDALSSVRFRVAEGDAVLEVRATQDEATYELVEGDEVAIRHYGKSLTVRDGEPLSESIPSTRAGPRPKQPHGRQPLALREDE